MIIEELVAYIQNMGLVVTEIIDIQYGKKIRISMEKYEQIKKDMVEVQSLYENHDSIIVCPVSSDILKSMKIIGQNINLDVITHSKNTLFF